jgi:hypothetical protein
MYSMLVEERVLGKVLKVISLPVEISTWVILFLKEMPIVVVSQARADQ